MAFITKSKLYNYLEETRTFPEINNEIINEGTILNRKLANKEIKIFDIFLSHSSLDKKDIISLYKYLRYEYSYEVYVDWIVDPNLERNDVTLKTAKTIRNRMRQSEKLILAASKNAILSHWTKWEIGYFDGLKEKVAILPIMNNEYEEFEGLEFLKLYPLIEENELGLIVEDINNYYGYTSNFNLNIW